MLGTDREAVPSLLQALEHDVRTAQLVESDSVSIIAAPAAGVCASWSTKFVVEFPEIVRHNATAVHTAARQSWPP